MYQGAIRLVDSVSARVDEVLSLEPDVVDTFSLSRDDRWIYFRRDFFESDIWLLTLAEDR